jgi:hypothetical protein
MALGQKKQREKEKKKKTNGFRFEALDENAVEEGDERPDRLEGSLGSLFCNMGQKKDKNERVDVQRTMTDE